LGFDRFRLKAIAAVCVRRAGFVPLARYDDALGLNLEK
jgi:hypothetical protein